MNRRRVLAIVAAVLLTVFGMVVIIAYVNAAETRAQETAGLVPILVAAEEIPAGTAARDLAGGLVAQREVPGTFVPEDAVRNIDELGRMVTVERILAGEPIVARQFGERGSAPRPGQAQLEEGREVITLTLEAQRALGGEIAPGDLVGVIVSLEDASGGDGGATEATGSGDPGCGQTGMVLTRVQVTAVSGAADPVTGEAGGDAVTVSLDVDQPDAERIAFAAEYGTIWLTRQTNRSGQRDDDLQSCDSIFGE